MAIATPVSLGLSWPLTNSLSLAIAIDPFTMVFCPTSISVPWIGERTTGAMNPLHRGHAQLMHQAGDFSKMAYLGVTWTLNTTHWPSPPLTVRTWKFMIGRRSFSFFGAFWPVFRGELLLIYAGWTNLQGCFGVSTWLHRIYWCSPPSVSFNEASRSTCGSIDETR